MNQSKRERIWRINFVHKECSTSRTVENIDIKGVSAVRKVKYNKEGLRFEHMIERCDKQTIVLIQYTIVG